MGGTSKPVWRISCNSKVEANSNCQQQIAVLQSKIRPPRRDRARPAYIERVVTRNQIGGYPCGNDRNTEFPDQLLKFPLRAREPDSVAGEEKRPLSGIQGLND